MNAKKILFAIIVFSLCLFAVSCSAAEPPENLTADGNVISWSAVEGAEAYIVYIGEETALTKNAFYEITDLYGDLSISVTAVVNGVETGKATIKVTVKQQLPAPTGVERQGNEIVWQPVKNAQYYVVSVDGVEYRVQTNSYTLREGQKGEVKVLAAGSSDGLIKSSDYSAAIRLLPALSTPADITCADGVIYWAEVENADGYRITINGDAFYSAQNRFDVKYSYAGEVSFTIYATASSGDYLNSSTAQKTLYVEKYTLTAPENLRVTDNVLYFDAVFGATGYDIYINGSLAASTENTYYALTGDVWNVKVVATSQNAYSSPMSQAFVGSATEISTLAQLKAIASDGFYRLVSDIELTEDWVPVAFSGVFEGNGHTISGINISTYNGGAGFFASLENATVTNLDLIGTLAVETSEYAPAAGALAGSAINSEISGCTAEFRVFTASKNGVGTVGGLIGYAQNANVSNCAFEGTVCADNTHIGGLIGKLSGSTAAACVNRSSAKGTVISTGGEQSFVGGFVGMFTDSYMTVSACMTDCVVIGCSYVGGFVGYFGTGKIENCLTKGEVTAKSEDIQHLGGFVGRLEGYNARVTYSVSLCEVTTEYEGEYIYAGAFAGKTVGGSYATVFDNCYFDKTACGLDRIGNYPVGKGDGIESKTQDELKNAATFSSFDSSIWDISEGNLPSLR